MEEFLGGPYPKDSNLTSAHANWQMTVSHPGNFSTKRRGAAIVELNTLLHGPCLWIDTDHIILKLPNAGDTK